MNLDVAQRKKVAAWIEEGAKLAEIQKRIETDFGLRMTYLDVRLLVDDLKLMPKDPTPVEAPKPAEAKAPESPKDGAAELMDEEDAMPAGTGAVSVSVDQLARPGTMISGKVTFS